MAAQHHAEAQRDADVAAIENAKALAAIEAAQQQASIKNEMHLAEQKARADASSYEVEARARANERLLTPAYLELQRSNAVNNGAKYYFGEKIPTSLGASSFGVAGSCEP